MNRWRVGWCGLMISVAAVGVTSGDAPSLERALADATRTYDLTAVTVVLARVRDAMAGQSGGGLVMLHAQASLALAELLRIEWEETPETEAALRRELGGRIDAVAQEGLAVTDQLAESSERERVRADLVATMIRSDFRARKYESQFRASVQRSLALDGRNPRAWVSSAKPFLFASPEHGGDLNEAVRLLDHAVELAPHLESALLLRALAQERLGDLEAARTDLGAVLTRNPDCVPARRALERIAGE